MLCPRCDEALRDVSGALVCPRHGLFLPAHEAFARLPTGATDALAQAMRDAEEGSLVCPECGERMRVATLTTRDESIHVDGCPSCRGWWLDRDEAVRLREAHVRAPRPRMHAPMGDYAFHLADTVAFSATIEVVAHLFDAT